MEEIKPTTILYVDDEKINLFLFQQAFSDKYEVLTAISGEKGLEVLDENAGKNIIVVSDMRMPVMDGVEFIKMARQKYNALAYFILTAFYFDDEVEKALQEKLIDNYFTKPFDVNVIKSAFNKTISHLDN